MVKLSSLNECKNPANDGLIANIKRGYSTMSLPKDAKLYHIYALLCPIDGNVKYIGATTNLSSRYHTHCAKHMDCKPTPKQLWIKSLREQGLKPTMWEIDRVDNYPEAIYAELWWKRAMKFNGMPLIDGEQRYDFSYKTWNPSQVLYDKHVRIYKECDPFVHWKIQALSYTITYV